MCEVARQKHRDPRRTSDITLYIAHFDWHRTLDALGLVEKTAPKRLTSRDALERVPASGLFYLMATVFTASGAVGFGVGPSRP